MEARVLALVEVLVELAVVLLLLVLLLVLPGAGDGTGDGDARKPDMFYKKKRTTGQTDDAKGPTSSRGSEHYPCGVKQ
jgi:hypothetical protein